MKEWIKDNIFIPWRTRRKRRELKVELPFSLFIELTNHCNFNCDFCTYGFMRREKRHMDFKLACHILDQIEKENIVARLLPHFVGEPFLYPYIFEFLEKAVEKGISVELFTNGSLLDKKAVERLYKLGIKRIILSFQTPDRTSFRFRHAPINFEEFLRKTVSIIEGKFNYNSSTEIEIEFLSTYKVSPKGIVHSLETIEQVREAFYMFEKIGMHLRKKFRIDSGDFRLGEFNVFPDSGEVFEILPGVEIYFRHACLWNNPKELLGSESEIVKRRHGYCILPFQMLLILSNGNMTCCCMDYEGEINLGNIREKNIKDVWLGERLFKIRESMKRGILSRDVCRRCQGEIVGRGVRDIIR